MIGKEQSIVFLRQYLLAREIAPWVTEYADKIAASRLNGIGGIAGSWRTDYSECTYSNPQLINGVLVDLSTIEKVREFYEGMPC